MSMEPRDSIAGYLSRVMNQSGSETEKNRVRVSIGGEIFTIVSTESEDYIRRVAGYVDGKITSLTNEGRVPYATAAVLAACNMADEEIKATATADNLRAQIKAYSDEITRLRNEVSELRREGTRKESTKKETTKKEGTKKESSKQAKSRKSEK